MWINKALCFCVVLTLGTPALSQDPLSAIDWLSDSLAAPLPTQNFPPGSDITENALPENVTVSEIDGPLPGAVGLLAANITGFPPDLWGQSLSRDLAGRVQAKRNDIYPAMLDLLMTLLLAEVDPPKDAGPEATLYLARLDELLALGALEEADAMLAQSGWRQPELFRRAFDVSLLLMTENRPCQMLRNTPELSPTFPARIFCLARGGDWDAAALSLETGRALGFLSDFEDALLARFLDPTIANGKPRLFVPPHPSPLMFRLLEAIGEPMPTANLPRAFAHADLHSNTGWKSQLEAAERLVRTRGLAVNRLEGLYFENKAAASGGIWERVRAAQSLDAALTSGVERDISAALPPAWAVFSEAELEIPFAAIFAHRLGQSELLGKAAHLARDVRYLSVNYEDVAFASRPTTQMQALLQGIATGNLDDVFSSDPIENAIIGGFQANKIPVRLQSLIRNDRLGEAMLRAIEMFQTGATGDLDELSDALAFFRAVGLEDVARRAALQLILLERRG